MGYALKVNFENAPPITIPVAYGDVYYDDSVSRYCIKVTREEFLSACEAVNYTFYPFGLNMVTLAPSYWGTNVENRPHGYVDYMYAGNIPKYPVTIDFGKNNFGAAIKYKLNDIRAGHLYFNDTLFSGGAGYSQFFGYFGFRCTYNDEECILFAEQSTGLIQQYDFDKNIRKRGLPIDGMPLRQTQSSSTFDVTKSIKVGIYNSSENKVVEWATYTADSELLENNITNDIRVLIYDSEVSKSKEFFNNAPPPGPEPVDTNPYAPGGTSGTGGGKGRFDTSSDPVDFPGLPTLSASRCGLITMFNPSVPELQQLSTKMWSKDFFDNVTKLISNPIDIIVALTIVPVSPPVSGREEVIAGLLSTGVTMNVVSSQYMSFSCGAYTVENFYDAALDYAPYTKASIYLPYIGVRQLNVDEIMGATLEIKYNIDLFTGACVAMIKVNNAVLYSFDGNIATQIPVNAANYASLYSSLIQGVASIATTAVTGGATAPSLAAQAASFAVNAVTSSKPTIQRAGGITGSNGLMAIQTPFLIFEIPRQSLPDSQQVYTGYPSNITYKLADLSGFTQVSDIHLDGIPATSEELTEIERLLKEGVII